MRRRLAMDRPLFQLRERVMDDGRGIAKRIGHAIACAHQLGFEHPAELEFAISSHHCIGIDCEIDSKLSYGRKLIASGKRSGSCARPHLIDDLPVDRNSAMQVQFELKPLAVTGALSHVNLMYYMTSTLSQEKN